MEQKEAYKTLSSCIENIESSISLIEKKLLSYNKKDGSMSLDIKDKFVVIYCNDDNKNVFYSYINGNLNQISRSVHNIMPTPSLNILMVMLKDEAHKVLNKTPYILNGIYESFNGKVISYQEYLEMYLAYQKNTLKSLVESLSTSNAF